MKSASAFSAYDDYAVREGSRRAVGIEGLTGTLEALVAQGFVLGIATNDWKPVREQRRKRSA